LQYGIDFTFMRWADREPTRWGNLAPVTVRLAYRGRGECATAAVAAVVAELRCLTQLDLISAEPTAQRLDPSAVPANEIHVGYVASGMLDLLPPHRADRVGVGGATTGTDPRRYISGFAIINSDAAGTDLTSPRALAVLRHELGHALGLGHATRRSEVMHDRICTGVTGYGRGDRRGLTLLGQPLPTTSQPRGTQDPERTPSCAN
jgi:hypothetical protein